MKYLTILLLFLFEFTIGQVPVNPRLIPRSATSQTFTLAISLSADLTAATITAVTLNNGRTPVETSGIIFGQTLPLTLATSGATITTNGNISGGTYSNTFTNISQSSSSFVVAYATNSFGTSYGKVLVIPRATVTSITGKVWMAYNLGASSVATSLDDEDAYGFLYQWGRISDGHQVVRPSPSETTPTRATNSNVNNGGKFIIGCTVCTGTIVDWLSGTANNGLWQPATGINDPCPTGFRIPTSEEFAAEMTSWTSQNGNGAFNSELKFTYNGRRIPNGTIDKQGTEGWYWTSFAASGTSNWRSFTNTSSSSNNAMRSWGYGVRCIKK